MVSPFITIVDRSIIQNASGAMAMGTSVRYETTSLLEKVMTADSRQYYQYSVGKTNGSNSRLVVVVVYPNDMHDETWRT